MRTPPPAADDPGRHFLQPDRKKEEKVVKAVAARRKNGKTPPSPPSPAFTAPTAETVGRIASPALQPIPATFFATGSKKGGKGGKGGDERRPPSPPLPAFTGLAGKNVGVSCHHHLPKIGVSQWPPKSPQPPGAPTYNPSASDTAEHKFRRTRSCH